MSKKVMTVAVFLSLIAGIGLAAVVLPGETAYKCGGTQQMCVGTHLSGGIGTRCYLAPNPENLSWKVCSEGWEVYENEELTEKANRVEALGNNCLHTCYTDEGRINSYTKCVCEKDATEAYLGELV